jgi:hypothetical protein
MDIYSSAQWHNFFLMTGTGAASLTGLLVIAISLHLNVIIKDVFLRHRASTILTGLSTAFIICALVLMGGQNYLAVGFEWLTISSIVTFFCIKGFFRALKNNKNLPANSLYRTIGTSCCHLVEITGAIILINGSDTGLYISALGMIANFYFMISGSWLLLVGVSSEKIITLSNT